MVCKYSPGDKQMVVGKGVISAFDFSEVRVFDLFSLKLILFILIPGLFYVYSGLNPGLNRLDQF